MIISEFSRILSVLVRTETLQLCCREESPPWDHKTQGNSVVVTQLVHNVRQFSLLDLKTFFGANGNSRECFMVFLSRPHHQHTTHNPFEWKKSSLNNIISTILGSLCETVMQCREKWAEWKEKIKKGFRKRNSSNYRRPSRAQKLCYNKRNIKFYCLTGYSTLLSHSQFEGSRLQFDLALVLCSLS